MRLQRIAFILLAASFVCGAERVLAQPVEQGSIVREAIANVCAAPNAPPVSNARKIGSDKRSRQKGPALDVSDWALGSGHELRISKVSGNGRNLIFADVFDRSSGDRRALVRGVARGDCRMIGGRKVEYQNAGGVSVPVAVRGLSPDLSPNDQVFPLNPQPPTGRYKECTRLGLLDNGVNYTRKDIADRLAYDRNGRLIGADYWEGDNRPFDYGYRAGTLDPRAAIFNPRRHGSMVASVVIDHSPRTVCIVPVRFAPFSNAEVRNAVGFFAAQNTRVVSIQVGRREPWPEFLRAIEKHPDILFVAAAGNAGRDLNRFKSFPAAYNARNLLVVAGTDTSERAMWKRSNFGSGIVEIAVAAEGVSVKRFDGKPERLSGTSFAAPKVAAFAATVASASPGLSGADLKQRVIGYASQTGVSVKGLPVLTEKVIRAQMSK